MFRPASPSDLDLLLSARSTDPVGIIEADRFLRELDSNHYRLGWSWIYERNGQVLARALWWGRPDDPHPGSLDCLWVDPSVSNPAAIATELVDAGHHAFREDGMKRLPEFAMDVATNWRTDPNAVKAVAWRDEALSAAGLQETIERLKLAWTRGTPVPQHSTRLDFEPGEDEAFLEVFRNVAQGSLDIHTQADLIDMGPAGQAQDDLEFYLGLPGDRTMWRIAFDMHGSRVGFIIPSRSAYDASVSYLGVVPEHRGHGFVDDLLAQITIMHSANGAPRITGTTDTTNAPMAAAFARAGYAVTEIRIVKEARRVATGTT